MRIPTRLDSELKFMGIRHGSLIDAADSRLSDAQLRALSGHRSENVILRYAQNTGRQTVNAAKQPRDSRTKKGPFVGMKRLASCRNEISIPS